MYHRRKLIDLPELPPLTRRGFIAAAGLAGASFAIPAFAASLSGRSKVDKGFVQNGKVKFPEIKGPYDQPSEPPPAPRPMNERIGFAVVALGRLSLEQILPAFAECHGAKLTGLVSGTPDKAAAVAQQYGIPKSSVYNYENFDRIKDNPDIQAVYIVLPNNMHREFVERAAKAGKHVLCEKPMATSSDDAKAMIDACDTGKVKLMIAYRCQYEPYNRCMIQMARSGELGGMRFIEAVNVQSQGDPDQWRLKKAQAGGGALPDIGLYCLNAARYVTGEEPDQVFAYMPQPLSKDARFKEVEERMAFMLRFPSGVIASCETSYDGHDTKKLAVRLEKGWMELDGAFAYNGKTLRVARKVGDDAGIEDLRIGEKNQFALEIDHMADCVRDNKKPRTPGEEGLQDQLIIEALYSSAQSGQPVSLQGSAALDTTRGPALTGKA